MKILNKHIGTTIILATLLVLLVLVGLQIFIMFVNQIGDIGSGQYGLWQVMQYVALTLPSSVYGFFPMAGLLGSLLGLGYLASNNELVVMRASGMSFAQIIWAVMRAAILLLIFATLVGEVIGPSATHVAQVRKEYAKTGIQVSSTLHGLWMRKKRDFVYIANVVAGKNLQGVYQYTFNDKHQLTNISYAKDGVYKKQNNWLLKNIVHTSFHKGFVTSKKVQDKDWKMKINLDAISASRVDPMEISLLQLGKLISFGKRSGLSVQQDSFIFWQRALQPLATLVMIFLAIPFIFGPLRTVPMGVRILTGVLAGFTFYLLNQFIGPFSLVYQIPPFISAIFPSLLFFAVGIVLMRKAT